MFAFSHFQNTLLVSALIFWSVFLRSFGFIYGHLLLLLLFATVIYVLRNAVAIGLQDLDATLIRSPLFGPVYETWFRKETYFRNDTRLLYLEIVSSIVKELAEEAVAAKGLKLVVQYENAPILGELYKRLEVPPRLFDQPPLHEPTARSL